MIPLCFDYFSIHIIKSEHISERGSSRNIRDLGMLLSMDLCKSVSILISVLLVCVYGMCNRFVLISFYALSMFVM